MNIRIISTPQEKIRSEQLGDWYLFNNDSYAIHVLDTLSPKAQLAVAIHELIEAVLCRESGVSEEKVCAFDDQYEAERKQGKHHNEDEPGDDPAAPYRGEHQDATFVERAVCHALRISWPGLLPLEPRLEEDPPKTPAPEPPPPELSESLPRHVLD